MGAVTDFREIRPTERAVCELCGAVIVTTNGGVHTALRFVPFERLLELHMAERHPNLCMLPAPSRKAAAA
jgi:hypothetical protein